MDYEIKLGAVNLLLLPERAAYIPEKQMLLIADWHLGKLSHFRKHGFFIPKTSLAGEFSQLEHIIERLPVKQVVFLGDLFHSQFNSDWIVFQNALRNYPDISFILTKGNHDILSKEHYQDTVLQVVDELVINDALVLSHEERSDLSSHHINIIGHIHPGVKIVSSGREVFHLPAFVYRSQQFILPAFGKHTGLHFIPPHADSKCFVILGDEIKEMKR